jgi:FtsH-binding integral membrane protein
VREWTGYGLVVGGIIGALATGLLKAAQQTQLNAQSAAWWVVVVTTLVPLYGYIKHEQPITGETGGFINGLGTGLGAILLLASLILPAGK